MIKPFFILITLIIIFGLGYFIVNNLFYIPCSDTILAEEKSPDGRYIATLFERDCGATTDFSTIVNLREINSKFDPDDGTIFVVSGRHPVKLIWKSEVELLVICKSGEVFRSEPAWQNIKVSYKTKI